MKWCLVIALVLYLTRDGVRGEESANQEAERERDHLETSDSNRHSEKTSLDGHEDLDVSAQAPAPTLVRIRPNVGPLTTFVAPATIYHRPGPPAAVAFPVPVPYALASGTKGVASPARKSRPAPPPAPVQQQQQPVQIFESNPGEPEPYSFGFDVRDEYGNSQYRKEEGDNSGAVSGSYGYTDAAGVYRQVEYTADADGFRAKVKTNEPGVGSASPADVELAAIDPPAGLYGPSGKAAPLRAAKRSGLAPAGNGAGENEDFGGAAAASAVQPAVRPVPVPTRFRPSSRSNAAREQRDSERISSASSTGSEPSTDSPVFGLRARA